MRARPPFRLMPWRRTCGRLPRVSILLPMLLCVPVFASGCFRDADPFDLDQEIVQVFAVLAAASDSATVLISLPTTDPFSYRPVRGAEVRLITPGASLLLEERTDGTACAAAARTPIGDGTGCYTAALPTEIEAGVEYGLDIRLADGTRVIGAARVPAGVHITAPQPGTLYTVACPPPGTTPDCRGSFRDEPPFDFMPLTVVQIEWDTPPAAARVDALFTVGRIVSNGVTYPSAGCQIEPETVFEPAAAERGRARWPIYSIYCFPPLDLRGWDTIYVNARIATYDSAYATYLDAVAGRDAAREESVSAGLDGAIGVFGAVHALTREVALVRVMANR